MDSWFVHGGRLGDARRTFGGAPGDWLDLSTGINPDPWPVPRDLEVDWAALPDEAALGALEAAAARHFGVHPRHVCALPGTEIGLRLLGPAIGHPDAVHVWPAYGTHARAVGGSAPIARPELSAAAGRGAAVILANPNNPDGAREDRETMRKLAKAAEEKEGWLVVDEAFADADPALSIAPDVPAFGRLVVFRSFGKFFGLAGVRLGFVIGIEPVIAGFRNLLGAWPVSAGAIAIGRAAYGDHAWIETTRAGLAEKARALDVMLARHGLTAAGHCPLFRLVETDDALGLFGRLARRHILTRPFDYNPRWLRFGLPADAAGLARLDEALRLG